MGRRQVVRHLVLVQASGGSNPSAPELYKKDIIQKDMSFLFCLGENSRLCNLLLLSQITRFSLVILGILICTVRISYAHLQLSRILPLVLERTSKTLSPQNYNKKGIIQKDMPFCLSWARIFCLCNIFGPFGI